MPIRVGIAQSATTRNAVDFNGERPCGARATASIWVWIARPTTTRDAVKFNGERRRMIARQRRFECEQRRPQPRGEPCLRPEQPHGSRPAADRAIALTLQMHSPSSRFGSRISTSTHTRERNAHSRVRLECATLAVPPKLDNLLTSGRRVRSDAGAHHRNTQRFE